MYYWELCGQKSQDFPLTTLTYWIFHHTMSLLPKDSVIFSFWWFTNPDTNRNITDQYSLVRDFRVLWEGPICLVRSTKWRATYNGVICRKWWIIATVSQSLKCVYRIGSANIYHSVCACLQTWSVTDCMLCIQKILGSVNVFVCIRDYFPCCPTPSKMHELPF